MAPPDFAIALQPLLVLATRHPSVVFHRAARSGPALRSPLAAEHIFIPNGEFTTLTQYRGIVEPIERQSLRRTSASGDPPQSLPADRRKLWHSLHGVT